MKNSRPRIKYSQTPHSISRRIEMISNKTASALLSFITRKTIGFGQGSIELPYAQIAKELNVDPRTISTAAKRLEKWGDIIRERVSRRIYRWAVVLDREEVIFDPEKTYVTKACGEIEILIDRSGPCGSNDQDHADQTIMIQRAGVERENPCKIEASDTLFEQSTSSLKKVFKETYLKKQQQGAPTEETTSSRQFKSKTQLASRSDDEPLYKFCLRSLKSYGVRQRVARKLCREFDHELIKSVLETVPPLSGVENVAGYLVTAIRDGGYEPSRCHRDKKNAHQVTGGRSNYAHLTEDNVKVERHRSVKGEVEVPIVARSVEETREEVRRLELEREERESCYRSEGKELVRRFRALGENVKESLKELAARYLEKLVPMSSRREEMIKDPTFQRMANRAVLSTFFDKIERGLPASLALERTRLAFG